MFTLEGLRQRLLGRDSCRDHMNDERDDDFDARGARGLVVLSGDDGGGRTASRKIGELITG